MCQQAREAEAQSFSKPRIACLVFLAFLEALLFGAVLDGWPSLEYMFKSDGVYGDLCSNATSRNHSTGGSPARWMAPVETRPLPWRRKLIGGYLRARRVVTCPQQDTMFNAAYLLSNVIGQGSAGLLGCFFDRFGLLISRIFTAVGFISGVLMMSFNNLALSWLIFPSTLLISFSQMMITITSSHIAYLAGSKQATCAAMVSAGIDVSAVVTTFMQMAYDAGATRAGCTYVYASLFVVHVLNTVFLSPKYKAYTNDARSTKANGCACITDEKSKQSIEMCKTPLEKNDEGEERSIKPFREYALTPLYIIHTFWLTVVQLRMWFMLGSFNSWLNILTDDDQMAVSQVTLIFGYLHFTALILAPALGLITDNLVEKSLRERELGEHKALLDESDRDSGTRRAYPVLASVMLTTLTTIALSISSLFWTYSAAYVNSMLVILLICAMYSTHFSFVQSVYPPEHQGKAFGVSFAVASIADLLEVPLFMWAEASDPPFQGAHVTLLVLSVVILSYPGYILISNKRHQ